MVFGTLAFLARRAATPAVILGAAFSGAAWFGAFELALGLTKFALPKPADVNERAQMLGVATIPVTAGVVGWGGWFLSPPMLARPEKVAQVGAWIQSLPLAHLTKVGVVSAAAAAAVCRAVQYKGGAGVHD